MKKQVIGGQAVLEGVMMRSPQGMTIAVRNPKGKIDLERRPANMLTGWKAKPFIRGVVNFINMLRMSMDTLTISATLAGMEEEEEKPSKFEEWLARVTGKNVMDIAMTVAIVLGLAFAIGLFVVVPNLLGSLLGLWIDSQILLNLAEGVFRLLIFVGYILAISTMKDIKRFFMYHGAEHRVVNCYEADLPLTVENARKQRNANPRCGTSFLILVMIVSIVVFSLTGWATTVIGKVLVRLALLPVVASLSYELLMLLAKHENVVTRILRAPGMWLQKLTTRDPEDAMLEVALAAFVSVMLPEDRAANVPADYRLPDELPEPAAEEDDENTEPVESEENSIADGKTQEEPSDPVYKETTDEDRAEELSE